MSDRRHEAIETVARILGDDGCQTAEATAATCVAALWGAGWRHVIEPAPTVTAPAAAPDTAARRIAEMRAAADRAREQFHARQEQ